ncbi:MAG: DNA sulfur modification protein DndD [Methanomicrobiales archaeon]|jgi:DNA sulfur modification protein DndD
MLLKSISIENIRIFKGSHTLDLAPLHQANTHKPIILIGGMNGAGKTTLFESIFLCLYGQYSPGTRITKTKYEHYVEQMVAWNKYSEIPLNPAIEVIFEFSHAGNTHTYTVKREWTVKPRFIEKLTVRRDGQILSDLESDQWQDLLNELIPPRFARLFLFDGEKIQNLVEDNADNYFLQDSFKSMLGLDLVERLKADLGIYLSRYIKSKELNHFTEKLESIDTRIREIEGKKDLCQQEKAHIQSRYDQIQGEIERQEQILASEGGSFARKREEFKTQKNQLDQEITWTENEIRNICTGLFPFSITPKYCTLLKKHLIDEDQVQTRQRSQEAIQLYLDELRKSIETLAFWSDLKISSAQQAKIREKFSALISQHLAVNDHPENIPLIHHLSQYEYHNLLEWIREATTNVPKQMHDLSLQLENLTLKRTKLTERINKAPSDDIIGPFIQKLNELHKDLGQLTEMLRKTEETIKEFDLQLIELERLKEKQNEEIEDIKSSSVKMSLAQQVTLILNDYVKELQRQKISQLSDNILACFTRLIRKDDYIKDIVIDENYSITLYEPDGHAIPKELLSAGEKEIFAVSLLWGLTLTSGRQLPFIIDTPLGRLDSEHRGNLVMDFFQHAGDQMIIFSTDTEVDKEYFRVLQPFITRAYHLDYSKKERQTKISPGYFWESEPLEIPT